MNPWRLSNRASARARDIYDRHYTHQTPGGQVAPPGSALVLTLDVPDSALWVTSAPMAEYVQHDWAGAWVCSVFRRERGPLASGLIEAAVAATVAVMGEPPELGFVSFVDSAKTARGRSRHGLAGACFRYAGWEWVGITKDQGLHALHLPRWRFPAASAPKPARVSTVWSARMWERRQVALW